MEDSGRDSKTKEELELEEEEAEAEAEAEVEIWNYILGYSKIAAVKCAIDLGIADAIQSHKDPITLSELSSTLGCTPSSLHRVMRFLVHQKIFKQKATSQGTTGYVLTPLSRRLIRQGGEKSKADFVLLESSPFMLASWQYLSNRVRSNSNADSAFDQTHGQHIWKYTDLNPSNRKVFQDAMASDATVVIGSIIEVCPEVFDGIKSVVDVGGGDGTALRLLVKAFNWIQGINFDLPQIISVAQECDGVKHVGGDMFDSIPKADAAFIMKTLHVFNDEECIKILKKCKEAIPKDGKVIIVDVVIGEVKNDKFEVAKLMFDMAMMAHTKSGKERTSEEWEYVIREAGFTHHTIKCIPTVQSVIEAFP